MAPDDATDPETPAPNGQAIENGAPIRSVTRTLAVLKAINRYRSLSIMEMARVTHLPYPTTCRVVRTLLYEGLIEQEPGRKHYRATALVHELSVGYQPDSNLVSIARPHLVRLTEAIGWPVSLTSRVGQNMVLRDSTHAKTTLTFEHYPPGFTFPLFESASGRLFLAHASDGVVTEMVQWSREHGADWADLSNLPPDALQKIRDDGYSARAWGQYNLNPGRTSAIAVPIFRQGWFEAALTVIYFAAAMTQEQAIARYVPMMQAAAAAIGERLAEGADGIRVTFPELLPRWK
jgi:IclR family mhp operon transcriptional activator